MRSIYLALAVIFALFQMAYGGKPCIVSLSYRFDSLIECSWEDKNSTSCKEARDFLAKELDCKRLPEKSCDYYIDQCSSSYDGLKFGSDCAKIGGRSTIQHFGGKNSMGSPFQSGACE